MKFRFSILLVIVVVFTSCDTQKKEETSQLPCYSSSDTSLTSMEGIEFDQLKMPDGFKIDVYARVSNARSMAMSPGGILYVGNRNEDKVYAVQDLDGDFKADRICVLDTGLEMPNGVAFKDGDLYVAEISKLWKYPDIENNLGSRKKELIYDDYPTDRHHGWKYIAFGPDGKLYIPVGAPCNICESKDSIYASITRMNADGSDREIYARGVRNTVGFTWHPESKELYFTDNNRDMMGDTLPNCELNRVVEMGQHFGYPYCHEGDLPDPEFGSKYPCSDFVPPFHKMGPHVAPLGLKFNTGNMFPGYEGKIFVAEHGSWNRTPEAGHTGHLISVVTEENGESKGKETLIEGFLNTETNTAWGRPVDILFLEDGSMLISDDHIGAIYRVWYEG